MYSDFIVSHPSGPFLELSEEEWKDAVNKYPSLEQHGQIKYLDRSATGSIVPGKDGYFTNESILSQFERFFQMAEFKRAFHEPVKHNIEIVVDNARTHTSFLLNIYELRLKPGGQCPYEKITWHDESGKEMNVACFSEDGTSKGLTKILCFRLKIFLINF